MEPDIPSRPPRPWWALGVAALALAFVAVVLITDPTSPAADSPTATQTSPMLAVSPGGRIELADLPADQQPLYRAAAADPDAFTQVTCYCGCVSFLDHRHLQDCFVRPDGAWERHATACAVCLAEARDVIDMRSQQVPIADIVQHIDDRFGGITPTT